MTSEKFIFMYLARTGGTAFAALLTDILGPSAVGGPALMTWTAAYVREIDRFRIIWGHISWRDTNVFLPTRKRIAFMRDPLDRCMSLYGHYKKPNAWPAGMGAVPVDAEAFFSMDDPRITFMWDNALTWQLGHHLVPRSRKDGLTYKELMKRAKTNLSRIEHLGFYETLHRDVATFRSGTGLAGPAELRVIGKTDPEHRVNPNDLDPAVRDRIMKMTEMDRELYAFALSLRGPE